MKAGAGVDRTTGHGTRGSPAIRAIPSSTQHCGEEQPTSGLDARCLRRSISERLVRREMGRCIPQGNNTLALRLCSDTPGSHCDLPPCRLQYRLLATRATMAVVRLWCFPSSLMPLQPSQPSMFLWHHVQCIALLTEERCKRNSLTDATNISSTIACCAPRSSLPRILSFQ